MRRRLVILAASLAATGWAAAPAAAHPTLVQAAPAPGVSQPSAPSSITLALTEAPVARGSSIRVKGLRVGPVKTTGKSLSAPLLARPKPGVYTVRWVALGGDGHTSSGRFVFGVSGKDGAAPPGAERLAGGGGTGTGNQSATTQDAVSVVARWLLLIAVSLLFGGGLLARRVDARDGGGGGAHDGAAARNGGGAIAAWRRAAPLAGLVAIMAAVEGVAAAATAGVGGSLDLGLVFATGPGVAGLVRLAVLLVTALVAPRRSSAWIAGGALALACTALDGHALSSSFLGAAGLVVHALAAGLWLGALLGLVVVSRWGGVGALRAARSFAPIAAVALAAVAITGVLAALREVDAVYFLEWTGYGRAVIAKTVLLAAAVALGVLASRRAPNRAAPLPKSGSSRARLLRAEVGAGIVLAALASLLAALPQGRGQLLPAARGNLLPGPAFATVLGPGGTPADITLAPARAGANRIVVRGAADGTRVRLACACADGDVTATLRNGAADVRLPKDGTWFAYLGSGSPAALPVGVPKAPGSDPIDVLAVADLADPGCRDFLLGLQLGVGRLNANGGLDGHRKVALLAYDDQDSAARAGAAVSAPPTPPLALAGACGTAAGAAVREAADRGIPAIVGDPAVPTGVGRGQDQYRVAGDPAADGYASAQYVRDRAARVAAPTAHTVRLFARGDEEGKRWIAGWRAGLAGADLKVQIGDADTLAAADRTAARRELDRRTTVAVGVDGPDALARSLARSGTSENTGYAPAPVLASGRTFSERFISDAGRLGRLGVVRGATEVSPDSRDGLTYSTAVRQLYPGSSPTLQGIRGYVTGLALGAAVRDGIAPADLRRRLARPAPFTDALAAPWRSDATGLGVQSFSLLGATFLSTTLVPPSQGGQAYSGTYFPDGAWSRLSTEQSGPPLNRPPLKG